MNIRAGKAGLSFASILTGALLASMAAPSRGQDAGDAKWQYEITPYLWAAGISGDIGLGPISTHTSAGFSDLLERLDFGAMGAFEARKDRWGVLFDGMYIELSNSEDIARDLCRCGLSLLKQISGAQDEAGQSSAFPCRAAASRFRQLHVRSAFPRLYDEERMDVRVNTESTYDWSPNGRSIVLAYNFA